MLARTETIVTIVENWLTQLEQALSESDDVLLKTLFHADSHWRDVLALTWRIMTVNGADAILKELRTHSGLRILGGVQPTGCSTAMSLRFAAAWARARGISYELPAS
jgi:hypothetical protein